MDGPPKKQRGSADPQALLAGGGGGLVAFFAMLGINHWIALGGLIISAISCGALVARTLETRRHNREMERIQRGEE